MNSPYSPQDFAAETGVSRETLARLDIYAQLLRKWQPHINLVSPNTLQDIWRRHFLDSAQLLPHIPSVNHSVVDLGTGAGFPGMVLAIMGHPHLHLFESDQRKVAFLRQVAVATATTVNILPTRIEASPPFSADVITARALAPLAKLLDYGVGFLDPKGICLFLKGKQYQEELAVALTRWTMTVENHPSRSDPSGVILRLSALSPRNPHERVHEETTS